MMKKYKFIVADVAMLVFSVIAYILLYLIIGIITDDIIENKIASFIANIIYNGLYIFASFKYITRLKKIGLGYICSMYFTVVWLALTVSFLMYSGNDWNGPAIFIILMAMYIFPVFICVSSVGYYIYYKKRIKNR